MKIIDCAKMFEFGKRNLVSQIFSKVASSVEESKYNGESQIPFSKEEQDPI
jgi:hypothetical protein